MLAYKDIAKLVPLDKLKENLRDFGLHPTNPTQRGTGQRPDIFFQNLMAEKVYTDKVVDIVQETMDQVGEVLGRNYNVFDYYGAKDADRIIVIMGSAQNTVQEVVRKLNKHYSTKVGVIKVRVFRPWDAERFLAAIPDTVKHMAVLDRTMETGSVGNPMHLDVVMSIRQSPNPKHKDINIVGGVYGLASKEFNPGMVKAVFDNLTAVKVKNNFTVGINDDVTHTSLEYDEHFNTTPHTTRQCVIWGIGGDGSVGNSQQAMNNIGMEAGLEAQVHNYFDAHKEGGVTVSHMRFGTEKIKSEYLITDGADFVSCSQTAYIRKFDQMLDTIKKGGKFLLNAPFSSIEEIEQYIPAAVLKKISDFDVKFYILDASKTASDAGLPSKRLGVAMQAAFYQLAEVLPPKEGIELMKKDMEKRFAKKGKEIVQANKRAIDLSIERLVEIDVPESWGDLSPKKMQRKLTGVAFVDDIMMPVQELKGHELPVSAFSQNIGGVIPPGTGDFEKRGIAEILPKWIEDKCIQCNLCTVICPHGAIRPFLLTDKDKEAAPNDLKFLPAKGRSLKGLNYNISVSSMDCTGCEQCMVPCPTDAIEMEVAYPIKEKLADTWDFLVKVPNRATGKVNLKSLQGSQFAESTFSNPGACAGCQETNTMRLLTQLYGDRLVVANSSGCSSVWGGLSTCTPFSTNSKGHGAAWARSLFEDTAEYSVGLLVGSRIRGENMAKMVDELLGDNKKLANQNMAIIPIALQEALRGWTQTKDDWDACGSHLQVIESLLKSEIDGDDTHDPRLKTLLNNLDVMRPAQYWAIGGDGWAYDIGYGGLDHVLSMGLDINILVFDNEIYANTGAQASKATQMSATHKFAADGKRRKKKNLKKMAMTYEDVYVASTCIGANMKQSLLAFEEAISYKGPSLIVSLTPCIDWGVPAASMVALSKEAVDCGYWELFRFDPRRKTRGKDPLILDSVAKTDMKVEDFLKKQNRFQILNRKSTDVASKLHRTLDEQLLENFNFLMEVKSGISLTGGENNPDVKQFMKKYDEYRARDEQQSRGYATTSAVASGSSSKLYPNDVTSNFLSNHNQSFARVDSATVHSVLPSFSTTTIKKRIALEYEQHFKAFCVEREADLENPSQALIREYWSDFANLKRALFNYIGADDDKPIKDTDQILPSFNQLKAHKHEVIGTAIIQHGGFAAVAQKLGWQYHMENESW